MTKYLRSAITILLGVLVATSIIPATTASATHQGEFFLQVTPSPLVLTLKPGETTTHELKIRNVGTEAESLKISARSFTIDNTTGEVKFDDTKVPAEIGAWTKFSSPNFTVKPGEWFTQKVTFAIPKEAGFSYSFALVINRQEPKVEENVPGVRKLKGSVAIFTLVNIDKPGATRTLAVEKFTTDQGIYEYLPANLNVRLKNTGNSIVRPVGNVFIQRGSDDQNPIATLKVNPSEGYILPGTIRNLTMAWSDGFPVNKTSTDSNGKAKTTTEWNWGNLSKLRMGRYTAKMVAIYNDGQRDVPVVGEVSFWVIPWKILLGLLVIILVLGFGIWSIISRIFKIGGGSKKNKRVKFRR